ALVECANYGLTSSPKLPAGTAIIDLLAKMALLQLSDSNESNATASTAASVAAAASTSAASTSVTVKDEILDGPDLDDPDCLAGRLISYCTELSCAADKAVRMRCVQLIYKVLSALPVKVQISDDTFKRIQECLLERAWDVCGPVRAESLRALNRLQNPSRRDCPVISLMDHVARFDPSAEVRRTALQSIAFTNKSIPTIVSRTRDIDDSVRKAAYDKLTDRANCFSRLDIQCRVSLLSGGLTDSAQTVVASAKRLASKVLQNLNNSFIELLRFLDVALSGDHCQQILSVLMPDQLPSIIEEVAACLDDRRLLRPDCQTSEASFLWLRLIRLLEERKEIDALSERLLPGGLDFQQMLGDVLKRQVTSADLVHDWIFLARQLLQLCSSLDLSDEFTHESLLRHAQEALKTAPLDLIEDLLQLRKRLYGRREAEFSSSGIELITEIRDAARDEGTLERCNLIAWKLLWLCDSRRLSPAQRSLVETLVLPSVKHTSNAVRQYAVSALSIACGRDRGLALTHVPLLMEIAKLDVPLVRVAALGGMFDCFLVFGMDTFVAAATSGVRTNNRSDLEADFLQLIGGSAEDLFATKLPSQQSLASSATSVPATPVAAESNLTTSEVVSSLLAHPISQLDSELSIIRTICAEGLSRLLLFGHVNAPKLVSRLFLLWFNPDTSRDQRLHDCLSQFFPAYSFTKPEYQLAVAKSAVYSLHTLFKAPPNSRLFEVDHNHAAQSPNNVGVAVLIRTLSLLQMRPDGMRRVLDTLLPSLPKVRERQLNQALFKYTNALAAHLGIDLQAGASTVAAAAARDGGQENDLLDDDDEEPVLLPDSQGNVDGFIGQLHADSNRNKTGAAASTAATAQLLNSTLAPGGLPVPAVEPGPPTDSHLANSTFRTPAGRPPQKSAASGTASAGRKRPSMSRVSNKSAKKQHAPLAEEADNNSDESTAASSAKKRQNVDEAEVDEEDLDETFVSSASKQRPPAGKQQSQRRASNATGRRHRQSGRASTSASIADSDVTVAEVDDADIDDGASVSSATSSVATRRSRRAAAVAATAAVSAKKPPLPPPTSTAGGRRPRVRQRVASSTMNSEESFNRTAGLDSNDDDSNSSKMSAATPRPSSSSSRRQRRGTDGEVSRRSGQSSRSQEF
uniref:Cnd3 domain-containing protein n=1 Tax=Macrostomum lignano TaxID=282301 RepID=A0A1I8HDL6_9PLAT